MKARLAGAFVTALTVTTLTSLAQSYNITDLGAVAGQNQSARFGLNALGQAAGDSSSPSGVIPILFSGGQAINLGFLISGDVSVATAMNDSGEILSNGLNPAGAKRALLLIPK